MVVLQQGLGHMHVARTCVSNGNMPTSITYSSTPEAHTSTFLPSYPVLQAGHIQAEKGSRLQRRGAKPVIGEAGQPLAQRAPMPNNLHSAIERRYHSQQSTPSESQYMWFSVPHLELMSSGPMYSGVPMRIVSMLLLACQCLAKPEGQQRHTTRMGR